MDKMLIIVLKRLEKFKEKPVAVKQKGFVSSEFYIKKLVYDVENDILVLKDDIDKTYFSINLNQIYGVKELKNSLCFSLDNDIQLDISFFKFI